MALKIGTAGNDRIVGTILADAIYGYAGNDTIYSGPGNDKIYAGLGRDTVYADAGNDIIYGGDGDDALYGEAGNDVIFGGLGNDLIDGGDGFDTVSYAAAVAGVAVDMRASSGNIRGVIDTLLSIEKAIGGNFNDGFWGDDNANTFVGGAGRDMFIVGIGGDKVFGGDDDDFFRPLNGLGNLFDGGAGLDQIDFEREFVTTSGLTISTVSATNSDGALVATLVSIEGFHGTAFGDSFLGAAGYQGYEGSGGNDVFRTFLGADSISGGAGSDRAIFNRADVVTSTGQQAGVDTFWDFTLEDQIDLREIFAGRTFSDVNAVVTLSANGSSYTLAADVGNGVFRTVCVLQSSDALSIGALVEADALLLM